MVSVLATFIIFGLLDSFRNAVATYGNDYANALMVQSRNVRLPYSHVERLLSMPGITTASGVLMAPARLPSDKRTRVQGVDDRTLFEAHPGIIVSPQAVAAWRQERTAVLISTEVAKDNGWHVGDHFMLPGLPRGPAYRRPDGRNALEIVVAGIFSAENKVAAQGIFAHYEYVRDLIGAERAGMEYIAVRLAPGQDVDVMRSRIDAEFASSAAPVKTYSGRALLRAYYGTYRELARLSVVVLGISTVTLLLIAGSVLVQSQRERARESAVLEAIGWSKARIALFIAFESMTLVLPPAVLGMVVAGAFASLALPTLIDATLLTVALIVAVSAVPVVRSFSAQIAPRLARE
jgi:putative ABC transport system permease protein